MLSTMTAKAWHDLRVWEMEGEVWAKSLVCEKLLSLRWVYLVNYSTMKLPYHVYIDTFKVALMSLTTAA